MHGGNLNRIAADHGLEPASLIDFSTGINPLGFPQNLRTLIEQALENIGSYPDPSYNALREALSGVTGRPPMQIAVGNGSSELLYALLRAIHPPSVITLMPSYIDYSLYSRRLGIPVFGIKLNKENGFIPDHDDITSVLDFSPPGSLCILGNPNNPTGHTLPPGLLNFLAERYPQIFFCVDEAYKGFTSLSGERPLTYHSNILSLHSLTKLFAVPGIRMGYLCGEESLLSKVSNDLPVWNVGAISEHLARAFLQDSSHVAKTLEWLNLTKPVFYERLADFPSIEAYPSDANFLLFQLKGKDEKVFYEALIKRGIVLRICDDFENLEPGFFRTSIRLKQDNERLFEALRDVLGSSSKPLRRKKKRASAIMFQGTSSNVGKSLMNAAFCRLLSNRGIAVAPFKAQNMSLNSYVTVSGEEIGRAQALQAAAARVEPQSSMNPVLLKPTGERISQVIVRGKPRANMGTRTYYNYKQELLSEVRESYDELAEQYEVIVLEGAGSPGEINLRKYDIVNMSMAGYAKAPVILVGDIDRGGVYASFIGHLGVMAEWERKLVKAFLVNKFRGDESLLESAHRYMLTRTGCPVIGVMPWIRDHQLPEEDEVNFDLRYGGAKTPSGEESPPNNRIVIGVVDLPLLSNSTDLDPFLREPGVRLVKIDSVASFKRHRPIGLIIPGSKNVMSDLHHLQEVGIAEAVKKAVECGEIIVVGICGGLQMLGNSLYDPKGVENEPGTRMKGMGLLNINTVLEGEKTLSQTRARFLPTDSEASGYEIHHGRSNQANEKELFDIPSLGYRREYAWGTYLHGLFDNYDVRRHFLMEICRIAGKAAPLPPSLHHSLDEALDSFAAVFEKNIDISYMMKLIGY